MTLYEGLDPTETIAAISTPVGVGGIGVIRLSGTKAHDVGKAIFTPKSHTTAYGHRKMVLGDIVDPERSKIVDEAFAIFMFAPQTYTREDMVEIQCHSGRVVLERILKLALQHGARLAGPGEFTLRAYLNGRIDLTQAEGVISVIQAQSDASLAMAQRQLHGRVRGVIESLLAPIREILTFIEADLDFSEDTGMDFMDTWQDTWGRFRQALYQEITRLMEGFATCQMIREGVEVAIVGPPNAGKSSILNRFVGKDRAIVTEIPGTTRDFIEEGILIQGIPFKIVDTAGLRASEDPVEKIGTAQSLHKKKQADIVLLVIDGARPLRQEETRLLNEVVPRKTILVLNKADLPFKVSQNALQAHLPEGVPVVEVSAKTGKNWEALLTLLLQKTQAVNQPSKLDTLIPINQRHYQLLKQAKAALQRLDAGLAEGVEEVFLSQDLWEAKHALESILGTHSNEDILSEIFRNFCVGK